MGKNPPATPAALPLSRVPGRTLESTQFLHAARTLRSKSIKMKAIPIPKRLRVRPQYRGLPIPYIALVRDNGQPDFRVTDQHKRHSVIMNRWCQLCGEPLGKWFFFVGGPEAAKGNQYFEPAAHLDCLIYAMQVCPFIVGRVDHADINKVQQQNPDVTVKADDTFSATRNPVWIIKKADRWQYTYTKDGTLLLVPHALKESPPLRPETMSASDWRQVEKDLLQPAVIASAAA